MKSKRLLLVTFMNLCISVIQVAGGLISNSLSLLSDAFHNLGDTVALFIAYLAGRISLNSPDYKKTFGYKRVEILAAFFNGVVLITICIFLFAEAIKRFRTPEPVQGRLMFIIAVSGLLINFLSMVILHRNQKENINIRTAYLHLLGDSLSSLAVIAGSIIMWLFNIFWIDPLISIIVGIFIIYNTWKVIGETFNILIQASPVEIDIQLVKEVIEGFDEIENIHHVHIWRLNDTVIHFEAHISVCKNLSMIEMMTCKEKVEERLVNRFGISHTTLQFEYKGCENQDLILKDH